MEKQLSDALKQFLNEDLQGIVLSNSRDREKLLKVQIRPVVIQESPLSRQRNFQEIRYSIKT